MKKKKVSLKKLTLNKNKVSSLHQKTVQGGTGTILNSNICTQILSIGIACQSIIANLCQTEPNGGCTMITMDRDNDKCRELYKSIRQSCDGSCTI